MKTKIFVFVSIVMGMVLSGCGGGGSSSSPATSATTTTTTTCTNGGTNYPTCTAPVVAPPVVVPPVVTTCSNGGTDFPTCTASALASTIVTSVPAATYPALSPASVIFSQINAMRAGMGSGLLKQNAVIDAAALAHWNYLNTNGTSPLSWHAETPGLPGFTGVDPQSRATAAGYVGNVGEVFYLRGIANDVNECISTWSSSVYHLQVLFFGGTEAGIAAGNATGAIAGYTSCVFNFGMNLKNGTSQIQLPALGSVLAFPYNGMADVPTSFNNQIETPIPVPDLNGIGHPITVSLSTVASYAPMVAINQFTLMPHSASATGVAVASRILVATGITSNGPAVVVDPYVGNLSPSAAVLIPIAALMTNTVYDVVFSAVVNGKMVTKNWSFTTGAQ